MYNEKTIKQNEILCLASLCRVVRDFQRILICRDHSMVLLQFQREGFAHGNPFPPLSVSQETGMQEFRVRFPCGARENLAIMWPSFVFISAKEGFGPGNVLDLNGKARKKLGPKGVLDRLRVACERLHELSMPPELRGRQDLVRTDTDLMNVVEQRILQSQRESEFENLPGKGRPLEFTGNPHADPETDLAYRILAKNGFAPEWVELNKDIRFQVLRWRAALRVAWIRHMEQDGMREFEHEQRWTTLLNQFEEEMQNINRKVLRYNLIVPFGRQIFGYKLEKELQRLQEEIRETKAISINS